MKGPREYKKIIAMLRRRMARKFGVKNGSLPAMDFPSLGRLLYNSKRRHIRSVDNIAGRR